MFSVPSSLYLVKLFAHLLNLALVLCVLLRFGHGRNAVRLIGIFVLVIKATRNRRSLHSLLPPNDGGVGLGQAVYAAQYLQDLKTQEG